MTSLSGAFLSTVIFSDGVDICGEIGNGEDTDDDKRTVSDVDEFSTEFDDSSGFGIALDIFVVPSSSLMPSVSNRFCSSSSSSSSSLNDD